MNALRRASPAPAYDVARALFLLRRNSELFNFGSGRSSQPSFIGNPGCTYPGGVPNRGNAELTCKASRIPSFPIGVTAPRLMRLLRGKSTCRK